MLDGVGNRNKIYAGDGDVLLIGGNSNDALYGEAGNDTLRGRKCNDVLNGGDGTDTADHDGTDVFISIP